MLRFSALAPDGSPVDGFVFDGNMVTYNGAAPVDAGIRVERMLPPTDDPQWLVPGVFYGENRPERCTRIFPRYTPGHVDVERMESDAWSFRADRYAKPTPACPSGLTSSVTSPLPRANTAGVAQRSARNDHASLSIGSTSTCPGV